MPEFQSIYEAILTPYEALKLMSGVSIGCACAMFFFEAVRGDS
jgi:hypothetical protein